MGEKAGLKVNVPPEDAPNPNIAPAITEAYEKAGASLALEIEQKWNDKCWQKNLNVRAKMDSQCNTGEYC